MTKLRYLPPETSREAKAKYRLRPEFRFTASQERAATRRHETDQKARKERTRQATLKRKKKEKDEQQKAEREAERLAANELIRRAREGGLGRVEVEGPLRPPSSQLPLFRFFPPQLPLPALDSIIPQQLSTPSPSNIRKPLPRRPSQQDVGFTLDQAWELTQCSSQNRMIRSDGLIPTRPSPPYPIQKHLNKEIAVIFEPTPTETQDNTFDLDFSMGDNLHDTYDLDSSMPFSEVQWPLPSNRARGHHQDQDTDQDDTEQDTEGSVNDKVIQPGGMLLDSEDEFPLSPSTALVFHEYQEEPREQTEALPTSEPDEYPLSSQTALAFREALDSP